MPSQQMCPQDAGLSPAAACCALRVTVELQFVPLELQK